MLVSIGSIDTDYEIQFVVSTTSIRSPPLEKESIWGVSFHVHVYIMYMEGLLHVRSWPKKSILSVFRRFLLYS
jgi:hypothetical protein